MRSKKLIIGYGNTLRSDDGVGQWVAEQVEMWKLPNVRSLCVFQLTPELAEEISNAKLVIFVDAIANLDQTESNIQIKPIQPENINISLGHKSDPRSLLYLTQTLYGYVPTSYWLLIPAINFDFGESLSPITQQASFIALEKIRALCSE